MKTTPIPTLCSAGMTQKPAGRALAFILVLALILTGAFGGFSSLGIPGAVAPAYAAGGVGEVYVVNDANAADYDTFTTAASIDEALNKIDSGGTIYMTTDIALTAPLTLSTSVAISTSGAGLTPNCAIQRDENMGADHSMFTVPSGCTVTLSSIAIDGNDIEVTVSGAIFNIHTGGTLTLNTDSILRNGNVCVSGYGGGGGIVACSGTFTMNTGSVISDCTTDDETYGGAVSIINDGNFTMDGGQISRCTANAGGGVYIKYGTFTMNDGTISNCTATDNKGGGVHAYQNGVFTMNGGTIDSCSAPKGGGGIFFNCDSDKTCTITGNATISNCTTEEDGGGIALDGGNLILGSSASIKNCHASGYGGGVRFRTGGGNPVLLMQGVFQITNCTADKDGGGLFFKESSQANASITMEGNSKIQNCSASGLGGGLYLQYYTFGNVSASLKDNFKITNCTAQTGAGIYNTLSNGILSLSGAPYIYGNTSSAVPARASNIYNASGKYVQVSSALTAGAQIGITSANPTDGTVAVSGTAVYPNAETLLSYFSYDTPYFTLVTANSDTQIVLQQLPDPSKVYVVDASNESSYSSYVTAGSISEAVNKVDYGGTIYLTTNAALTETITLPTPVAITSSPSGLAENYTITRAGNMPANSRMFTVPDGSAVTLSNITIDGQNIEVTANGALFSIEHDGSLTLDSGALLKNGATSGADGSSGGGGIFNDGSLFMKEGSLISGCYATGGAYGGGVYVKSNAGFTMNGGGISSCTATEAGGVMLQNSSEFFVSGTPRITGNTLTGTTSKSNIYIGDGIYINVINPGLTGNSLIGVTLENPTYGAVVATGTAIAGEHAGFFAYDTDGYAMEANTSREIILAQPASPSPSGRSGGGSTTLPITTTDVAIDTSVMPFSDVAQGAWYYDSVTYVYKHNLIKGITDTLFAPNKETTRGMLVTVLWRMENEPAPSKPAEYTDVKDGKYYTDAVSWASENEIIKGYGNGVFAPNASLTREQLAAILYNYVVYKGGGFTGSWMFPLEFDDASQVSDWAYESVAWCSMNGILNGVGGNTLNPKGPATRAEVSAMLQRLIDNMAK